MPVALPASSMNGQPAGLRRARWPDLPPNRLTAPSRESESNGVTIPSRRDANRPILSERGQQAEAQRRRREAVALRENLAKRKAQQRSRHAAPSRDKAPGDPDEPGE